MIKKGLTMQLKRDRLYFPFGDSYCSCLVIDGVRRG